MLLFATKFMRIVILTLLVTIYSSSVEIRAQNQYSPFVGALNIGTGICSVVDFNRDNNGFSYSYQLGIETFKFINNQDFLAIGFRFTKRGTRYIEKTYTTSTTTTAVENLILHYFDIPISFHTEVNLLRRYKTYFFVGLNNSILYKKPIYSLFNLDPVYYRDYNISAFSGITLKMHKRFKYRIYLNQSLISVIKKEHYDDVLAINSEYSPKILSAELLVSCVFTFN